VRVREMSAQGVAHRTRVPEVPEATDEGATIHLEASNACRGSESLACLSQLGLGVCHLQPICYGQSTRMPRLWLVADARCR
jgi:hypothetical protein